MANKEDYPLNKNPYEPWNSRWFKNDPFAPHNDPFRKYSPYEPWNSPYGSVEELDEEDRKYYGY